MYIVSLKTMKTNITIVQSRDLFKFGSKYSLCSLAEHPRTWKSQVGLCTFPSSTLFMTFTSRMQRQQGLSTLSVTRMVVRNTLFIMVSL